MSTTISPANNSVDVSVNTKIELVFDKDLKKEKVNRNTIIVVDYDANRVISCGYSVEGPKVTIMPQRIMETHTLYKVYIIGADDETAAFPLTFSDDSTLAVGVEYQFKTGESYDKDGQKTRADEQDSVEDYPVIPEGTTDLTGFIVSGEVATDLEIQTQYPMTGDVSVRVDQPEIRISFTHPILGYGDPSAPSVLQVDLDKMLTIRQRPLLDKYLIFSPIEKTFYVPKPLGDPEPPEFSAPTGVVSIDGNDVVFTVDAGMMWNANTVIEVEISPDIVGDIDGVAKVFSVAPRMYSFATEIYPAYTGTNAIRFRLGSLSQSFSDIAIQASMLYASVEAYAYSRCAISLYDPPYIAKIYTELAAALYMIQRNAIGKEASQGKSMELGDLKVQYNSPRLTASETNGTMASIKEELPFLAAELAKLGGSHGNFAVGVMGEHALRPQFRQNNWDLIGKHIYANTIEERALRVNVDNHRLNLNRF